MAIDETTLTKLEARLLKEYREDVAALERRFDSVFKGFKDTEIGQAKYIEEFKQLHKLAENRAKMIEEAQAKAEIDTKKTIGSTELAIKRLEREIAILTKEIAALKKEALTGADMKALSDRIKKLESAR